MESPWKPFLKENILNPYPMYQKLRETDPVHRSRTGEWVITRYEDAKRILKDDQFKVGNRAEWLQKASTQHLDKWESFSIVVDALKSFVVFKNPPDHTLLRKFIMKAWNNREVDQIINENIDQLLMKIDPNNFELNSELAQPLPALTMTRILGLPLVDYQYLANLSHQMIQSLDIYLTYRQIEKMKKATVEFMDYFERHAQEKLKNPDSSLLSRLVNNNKENPEVPHHELIANCYFLFIAGEETTSGSIQLSLYHLIKNNKLSKALIERQLVQTATDELLRYDSPTQIVVRIATAPLSLHGRDIKEGDPITICLGAANRDPLKFAYPDELMLDRNPNHHLAFASGVHRCLGDWLAKKELELLLEKLIGRFDRFKIVEEPVWKENLNMRSLHALHVSCA